MKKPNDLENALLTSAEEFVQAQKQEKKLQENIRMLKLAKNKPRHVARKGYRGGVLDALEIINDELCYVDKEYVDTDRYVRKSILNTVKNKILILGQNKTSFKIIHKQITKIKNTFGLNILEVAAVLQVSRQTLYIWLEFKDRKIQKGRLTRLNNMYEICDAYKNMSNGYLGSYLRKPTGDKQLSLFDLLILNNLNQEEIYSRLDIIYKTISEKRIEANRYESFLKENGFEGVSEEDRQDALDSIETL